MWKCPYAGCKDMHADFRVTCPVTGHPKPVRYVPEKRNREPWRVTAEREERRDRQSCCHCSEYVAGDYRKITRCECCDEPIHKKCKTAHEPKCSHQELTDFYDFELGQYDLPGTGDK